MRKNGVLLACALLGLGCAPALAGLTVPLRINPDGTVDSRWPAGNKPLDPVVCSTWTCTAKGDAALGQINEISPTQLEMSVSGSTDGFSGAVQSIDYAYQLRTSGDAQITAQIPETWTGHLEDFTGFAVGVTEGTAADDWVAYVIRFHNGSLRFKYGVPGTAMTSVPGPNLPLPLYVGVTFGDSTVTGWYSTDGEDWFEIGSTTRDLSNYPVWVGGTSHEVTATTTAELTVAYSTTVTISDAGDPPPPTGDDTLVSTGTSTFDCTVAGLDDGDSATLDGTARGPVRFQNCVVEEE